MSAVEVALRDLLVEARDLGFLGPGDIETHIRHAHGFADVEAGSRPEPPESVVDLGSGGGVPALVLSARWPHARIVLVESMVRRARFLRTAVDRLHLDERVVVIEDRAETVAQAPAFRESFDLVTARGFGPPAATAEIASGLAKAGGSIIVSDPPEADPERWPTGKLSDLGLGPAHRLSAQDAHYVRMAKVAHTPTGVPRAVGRPTKRPLW